MDIRHVLVILADDAGHRALPVRLPATKAGSGACSPARKTAARNSWTTIIARRRPAGCCRRQGSP
jgi:hypothetical protein